MNIEQIRLNAELMKSKGLDAKLVETAKEAYEFAKNKIETYSCAHTHVLNERIIAEILGIYGGSVNELKILDVGCGDGFYRNGEYGPLLSTALSSLGAKVTGIDLRHADNEDKKRIKEKFGFDYEKRKVASYFMDDEKTINLFGNKDLVIFHSLLYKGFLQDSSPNLYYSLEGEWREYVGSILEIGKLNSKDTIFNLQIPPVGQFPYMPEGTEEEKVKYALNKFKYAFGEILFGEEKENSQVFVKNK